MYARCPRCKAALQVPNLSGGDKIAVSDASSRFCFGCGESLVESDQTAACEQCGAIYHNDCWQERGRCLAPQCPSRQRWRPTVVSGADLALCSLCGEPLPANGERCARCSKALAMLNHALSSGKKQRTSYSAGLALIGAIFAIMIFTVIPPGALALPAALLASVSLSLGVYALRRIRASSEPVRGIWAASTAIGLALLALLKFFIDLIASF